MKREYNEWYIELFESVCSSFNSMIKDYHQYHYENEYPNNYKSPKRKRKLIWDLEDRFIHSLFEEWFINKDLKLNNCS